MFRRPSAPQFRLVNLSEQLVREPKYQFLVYDLDVPGLDAPYLNLRIPVDLLRDYIRPKSSLGPWGLLSIAREASRVQEGHKLFGYVQVQCPDCIAVRHYWLFFHLGHSGWFSEIPAAEHSLILQRLAHVIHGSENPIDAIDDAVPLGSRIEVR